MSDSFELHPNIAYTAKVAWLPDETLSGGGLYYLDFNGQQVRFDELRKALISLEGYTIEFRIREETASS